LVCHRNGRTKIEALRPVLGLKREKVARRWEKIHDEIRSMHVSPDTRVYPEVSGLAAWSENCK
jgi:hypothetical protein